MSLCESEHGNLNSYVFDVELSFLVGQCNGSTLASSKHKLHLLASARTPPLMFSMVNREVYLSVRRMKWPLMGSAFGFGPGDLSSIPDSCVTLCFLPHHSAKLNKGGPPIEWRLYGWASSMQ